MRKLVFLLVIFAASVSAYAGPVNVDFVNFGPSGQWQNGYPYWGDVQSLGFIALMCDDYTHGGSPGDQWLANITNLGTQNLSLTRFGNMNGALTLYDEAGWLLLETEVTGYNQWKDMNYAVWHIFDPSSPLDGGAQAWLTAAQNEAAKGFPNVNFNLVGILTPVDQYSTDPNGPQEFLYLVDGVPPNVISPNQSQSAPEPGTLVLVGTGLAAVLRRRWIA